MAEAAAALKEQGNALVKQGKHPQARVLYDESIRLWPADPAVYTNRALCLLKAHEYDTAVGDCRACVELDASFVRAHERLCAVYEAQKDPAAALREYKARLAKDPGQEGCARGAMVSLPVCAGKRGPTAA